MWKDIACIVFVCVTANHLGLISAILETVAKRHHLPIVSCPKCLTFWSVLVYLGCGQTATDGIITVLAISFLASYTAIWLELFEGYIDTLYLKLYGKITTANTDDTDSEDADNGDSASTVPELQQNYNNEN